MRMNADHTSSWQSQAVPCRPLSAGRTKGPRRTYSKGRGKMREATVHLERAPGSCSKKGDGRMRVDGDHRHAQTPVDRKSEALPDRAIRRGSL